MNNLISKKVHHKEYGDGEVVKIEPNKIYVAFARGQRIFDYPDAFENGYLSADVEVGSSKETPVDENTKSTLKDNKTIRKKPSDLHETAETIYSLANEYGVLDDKNTKTDHKRFYLGKESHEKSQFLVCARAGWLCVYFNSNEKMVLENNGFPCEPAKDKTYHFKTRVNAEDFDEFLKIVQKHLGR